jgi:hypothetical protein
MDMDMEDKGYVYPDPNARRRIIVLAIFSGTCVLAVGLLLHSVVRPWLGHYFLALEELAKHDPLAANRSLRNVLALVFAVNGSLAFGLGIWTCYTGWQMTRAERWPRPGAKVYRRVKILDANSTRRRGKVLIGVGLLLVILVAAVEWKAYRVSSTFFEALRPNNRLQPTAPGAAAEPNR